MSRDNLFSINKNVKGSNLYICDILYMLCHNNSIYKYILYICKYRLSITTIRNQNHVLAVGCIYSIWVKKVLRGCRDYDMCYCYVADLTQKS